MIQQRRKDYLQKLIEDLFSKLHQLRKIQTDMTEKRKRLKDCFDFFEINFSVQPSDTALSLIQKIGDEDLLEQYAKLLLNRYEMIDIKDVVQLHVALDIVQYLEVSSITYSWERTVLKEDLLRLLNI